MGSYEATNVVLARIKNLEPENATKIMGYFLMNLEENELAQLACSSDPVLHTLIHRVNTQLGFSSNSSSAPSIPCSSPRNGIARPFNGLPFSQSSLGMVNNSFDFTRNPVSPSSHGWPLSRFPNNPISPKSSPSLPYQSIWAGSASMPYFSPPVHADCSTAGECIDEQQMNGYFSFLNEEHLVDPQLELDHGAHNCHSPSNGDAPFHKRSYSASEVCLGSEEGGAGNGLRPCLYFNGGFYKNCSNCKFVHGGLGKSLDASSGANVGSPNKFDGFEQRGEFLRLKAGQHKKLAAMPPSSYEKHLDSLLQQQNDPQRAAAAAWMMGEEFYRRCRQERHDFLAMMSSEKQNSASRQIYLTFPAESTFKDEDVSEYFRSKFGPVQDVRIPYQQKRMFGFVSFVFPETVKLILSKGNPHFICDSRVLVKPYKEKGKVPDKRQQQQHRLETGNFSQCLSPLGFDSKEPYDVPFGPRMLYNHHLIFLRRKLEEQELQQAIELQGRRQMNPQLPDFRNSHIIHHQRSLSVGAAVPSEQQLQSHISNAVTSDSIKDIIGNDGSPASPISLPNAAAEKEHPQQDVKPASINDKGSETRKDSSNTEIFCLLNCVEPVFHDSLFAPPTKAAGENPSDFSVLAEVHENAISSTSSSCENNL